MQKELDLKNVVAVEGKEYILSTVKLPYSGFGHLPYETMLFAINNGETCIAKVTQQSKKQENVTNACLNNYKTAKGYGSELAK